MSKADPSTDPNGETFDWPFSDSTSSETTSTSDIDDTDFWGEPGEEEEEEDEEQPAATIGRRKRLPGIFVPSGCVTIAGEADAMSEDKLSAAEPTYRMRSEAEIKERLAWYREQLRECGPSWVVRRDEFIAKIQTLQWVLGQ